MFWVLVRESISTLPNAHGPFEGLDAAEDFASKLINPATYKVVDSEGKFASQVTISAPQAAIQRAK